jgi:hypothetical protein
MSKPHRDLEAAALDLARGLHNYADGFRVTNGILAALSWDKAAPEQRARWMRIAADALGNANLSTAIRIYEAYAASVGVAYEPWISLSESERGHWLAAARAVRDL